MRKTLSVALAALTLAGGALSAGTADARDHRHYYNGRDDYRGRHNNNDAALVAGIAGLAIGAALAGGSHYDNGHYRRGYYDRRYYGPRYYDGGYYVRPGYTYGYGYAPRRCRTTTFWDPYADAYVRRTNCW